MTPLITPTVHINGTSKQELVRQLTDAAEAARVLQNALRDASPNARDYYTQGGNTINAAIEAWVERRTMIDDLVDELLEHAMKITLK